jgi:hypothetical protein
LSNPAPAFIISGKSQVIENACTARQGWVGYPSGH